MRNLECVASVFDCATAFLPLTRCRALSFIIRPESDTVILVNVDNPYSLYHGNPGMWARAASATCGNDRKIRLLFR